MASCFYCPACGQAVRVDAAPGTQVRCGLCQAVVTVPQTAPGAPPTEPSIPEIPRPLRTGLATGALVCGIVGLVTFCFPVGLVGLVMGIVALVKANRRPDEYGGSSRAIAGICTGAVGLVLFLLAVSITLPSLARARELAMRSACSAKLRMIGSAMQTYANANNGSFPPDFNVLLVSGSAFPTQFFCPTSGEEFDMGNSPFLMNPSAGVPEEELRTCYEYIEDQTTDADPDNVLIFEKSHCHADEGGNVLFVDGHVEFIAPYERVVELVEQTRRRLDAVEREAAADPQ